MCIQVSINLLYKVLWDIVIATIFRWLSLYYTYVHTNRMTISGHCNYPLCRSYIAAEGWTCPLDEQYTCGKGYDGSLGVTSTASSISLMLYSWDGFSVQPLFYGKSSSATFLKSARNLSIRTMPSEPKYDSDNTAAGSLRCIFRQSF
jgi:hypothetical protein